MRESKYQSDLIKKIKLLLPGCFVQKNDSSYTQGVPDLLILYGDRWAMLEVKARPDAAVQPNQEFYVEQFGAMSYASFIDSSTEERVLDELQRALRSGREARIS